MRQLENEKRSLERNQISNKYSEQPEKHYKGGDYSDDNTIRELKNRIRYLENSLHEKETELTRYKNQNCHDSLPDRLEIERLKTAVQQSERLLEAREQSHRQQILRLENQVILTYILLSTSGRQAKPAFRANLVLNSLQNFHSFFCSLC